MIHLMNDVMKAGLLSGFSFTLIPTYMNAKENRG